MRFFGKLLISYLSIALIFSLQIKAQGVRFSKEECVNKLVKSCNNANYFHYGIGSSVFSTSDRTPSGKVVHIFCLSDANGTSCYQNHAPWFSCSPDHTATYRGTFLTSNSTDDVDDEICYTADRLASGTFGNIFNDNVKAVLEKNEKRFNKQMENLHKSLNKMNTQLRNTFRSCFPFCNGNPFGPGFPFNG